MPIERGPNWDATGCIQNYTDGEQDPAKEAVLRESGNIKTKVRISARAIMDYNSTKMDESGIDLDFDFDHSVFISEEDDTLSELLNSNFYELRSKTIVPENQT